MDQDLEETGELAPDDREFVERCRVLGMETPAIGLDSKESFKKLMRALDARRERQRRRRLLLACLVGVATVIIGVMAMLRLLHR